MDERMVGKVLRRAAELVRQGWCQDALALDERGESILDVYGLTDDLSPRAARWCILGAQGRASYELLGNKWSEERIVAHGRVERAIGGGCQVTFNNAPGRTAEEVADLLERAAEAAP